MTSGLVILSNAVTYGYPFMESIKSILPAVDEMVVVLDANTHDGTRELLETLPVRIIPGYFNLDVVGWQSYAIMRTMGYQACKGDIVVMFDADGVVHENDVPKLKNDIEMFKGTGRNHAYWMKYRLYKPTMYRKQAKHSGIYNKAILGDNFDFFHPNGKGIPNLTKFPESKSFQFSTYIYGYEHFWDTEEVFRMKVNRYGIMIDKAAGRTTKTPHEYFDQYMRDLLEEMETRGVAMDLTQHPASMQEKMKTITPEHFSHNWFGYAK